MNNFKAAGRLLGYVKPYAGYLFGSIFFSALYVGASLSAPVVIGQAIDAVVGKGNVDFAVILQKIIILAIISVTGAISQWLFSLCSNKLTFFTASDLRKELFAKLEKVPLKTIDSSSQGDIISRMVSDVEIISDGLLQGFSQIFTGVVTIIGTLGFMLAINRRIALVVVVLTPISLFAASFISKKSYTYFKAQSEVRGKLSGYVEEYVGGQRVVKEFAYENRSVGDFDKINEDFQKIGVKAQFFSALTNPTTRFVNGIVYAAVAVTGAFAAISGHISIGSITCFLSYANQYTKPFNEISGVITELQNAIVSAQRVFEVLDGENESDDSTFEPSPDCSGNVSVRDVSFSYSKDRKLIENLNLEAKKGSIIAIVGPTGCGKTTIINLLMRFYDVDSGEILIDGRNINTMKRADLRGKFGMVLQETWLFKGTIRENIAYGKPEATDEEIISASRAAHAHSFIKRLENGYDTVISEDGGNLSQGQKQLLCIARIMLTHPPMLILDEATSSIDTRTEIRIQKAFAKIMEGRTTFIVAHRLSTIKEADTILVMNNGSVIEQGRHDELLKNNGFYANLYRSRLVSGDEET